MKLHHLFLSELTDAPLNANLMDPARLNALVALIRREGFHQPVVVRPAACCDYDLDGEYEIIDGHHRALAMREIDPAAKIPAVVVQVDNDKAKLLSLGLNRLRGEQELATMADMITSLTERWSETELGALLDYSEPEILDLLQLARQLEDSEEDTLLTDMGKAPDDTFDTDDVTGEADPEPTKPWEITLQFGERKVYNRVKRALKRAAGKDGTFEDGLLRLMEG